MVSINQTDRQLKNSVKAYKMPEMIKEDPIFHMDDSGGIGRTIMFESQMMMRLNNYPATASDFGLLQHEIFHVAEITLHDLGMNLTHDSDEAYAYLIQFITIKIYELLKFKQ